MTRLPADATALRRPVLPVLTPRELQAIQLLARQMSTPQISAAMSISVNTVRTRVRRALRKLGTDDRQGAVQMARERGLI
jgi:DNA-binding CsgD family transcriptional regulator